MQSDADSEEVRHETISKTQAASRILDIVMSTFQVLFYVSYNSNKIINCENYRYIYSFNVCVAFGIVVCVLFRICRWHGTNWRIIGNAGCLRSAT